MNFLAISGSGRQASTNTAMLRAVAEIAHPSHQVTVFDGICGLPVFSPDLGLVTLPKLVQDFASLVRRSDGVIISSPEYVRAIPGGLKNAIDWLVSSDEFTEKPIVLMHASHRGDDMLAQIRMVLSTISMHFSEELFLRFELMKKAPDEIAAYLEHPLNRHAVAIFLQEFAKFCRR
jgi:chromate reductase, NAD(P)H dehydrogenase (quinone)